MRSEFVNKTPCRYGFIGNVDAFSIDNLRSEVKMRPDVTVSLIIREAELFRACPLNPNGLKVIEGDTIRDGDVWDVHDLRQGLTSRDEN